MRWVTNTPVDQVINAALAECLEANAGDVVHAAFTTAFSSTARRSTG